MAEPLPLRTRVGVWLARVLRVGQGPKSTVSSETINNRAHAEALAQQKGMH